MSLYFRYSVSRPLYCGVNPHRLATFTISKALPRYRSSVVVSPSIVLQRNVVQIHHGTISIGRETFRLGIHALRQPAVEVGSRPCHEHDRRERIRIEPDLAPELCDLRNIEERQVHLADAAWLADTAMHEADGRRALRCRGRRRRPRRATLPASADPRPRDRIRRATPGESRRQLANSATPSHVKKSV